MSTSGSIKDKPIGEKPADLIDENGSNEDLEATVATLSKGTPAAEAKLLMKMDMFIVPWLALLYFASSLDRLGVEAASGYDLVADLGMTYNQFLWCITVFFFSFGAFALPGNLIMQRLGPRVWLSTITILFGILMLLHGFVHNNAGLQLVRFFLGVTEAGLFPGIVYYLSCFYKPNELGFRLAVWFGSATFEVALFGGMLAAGFADARGAGGKAGWCWIFIIAGLITVGAGGASFIAIQDSPANAPLFKEEERVLMMARMKEVEPATKEESPIAAAFKDWRTYVGSLCFAGAMCPAYALTNYVPSVITMLNYTSTPGPFGLLGAPPNALGAITAGIICLLADRTGKRGLFNIISCLITMVGYAVLIGSRKWGVAYFGTFLVAGGAFPLIANTLAWVSSFYPDPSTRSVAIGIIVGARSTAQSPAISTVLTTPHGTDQATPSLSPTSVSPLSLRSCSCPATRSGQTPRHRRPSHLRSVPIKS
ncbi:MFS general substrate transporter, partial [Clavulina sp. PMI_390]